MSPEAPMAIYWLNCSSEELPPKAVKKAGEGVCCERLLRGLAARAQGLAETSTLKGNKCRQSAIIYRRGHRLERRILKTCAGVCG